METGTGIDGKYPYDVLCVLALQLGLKLLLAFVLRLGSVEKGVLR